MTIQEIKTRQEAALAEYAYCVGLLTYAGGTCNEPDAPTVEFPDAKDYERLSPIWFDRREDGFRDAKTVIV